MINSVGAGLLVLGVIAISKTPMPAH